MNQSCRSHAQLTALLAIQLPARAALSRAIILVFNLCHQLSLTNKPRGQIQSGWELKCPRHPQKFLRNCRDGFAQPSKRHLQGSMQGWDSVCKQPPPRGQRCHTSARHKPLVHPRANPSCIPVCVDACWHSNNMHREYWLDAICRHFPEGDGSAPFLFPVQHRWHLEGIKGAGPNPVAHSPTWENVLKLP